MGSLSVRVALASLAVLLLLAGPAGAAPRWSDPQTLSPPDGLHPQVAMDARGNTIVVWWQRFEDGSEATGYRWWLPGRGWTGARYTPRGAGLAADVAITPLGEATVVLAGQRAERVPVTVATARPGEAFGDYESVTESASGGAGFALGVDDVGNAIVAWTARDDRRSVLVATRRPHGRFGTPRAVGEDSAGGGHEVAINPAGAAAVSWMASSGGRPWVSFRPPGGSFGWQEDPGLIGPGGHRLGIDTTGRVVVASDALAPYVGQPGYNVAGGSSYSIRSPLGEWSQPQSLDQTGFVSALLVEPLGAITFLIDHRTADQGWSENRAIRRLPDGRLAGEQLSTGRAMSWAMGAMNVRGDVLASWPRSAGEGHTVDFVARERLAGATEFGPEVVLGRSYLGETAPALNDLGQAIVAWTKGNPSADQREPLRVQAVVRDDPALRALPLPPDVDLYADPLAGLDPDGDLVPPVRCAVSCKVRATGIVFPGGGRKAVGGSGKTVRLRARRRTRVKLDFGSEGAQAVRDAIAAGERPWVSVSVTARGRSPRPMTVSRRYRLGR